MSEAVFRAAAAGFPLPITWQWQVSDGSSGPWTDVSDGSGYSGATTARLTVEYEDLSLAGFNYRAVATNSFGSATSDPAELIIVSDGSS